MTKEYSIQGMTCQSCVGKVKQALESLNEVKSANIQLTSPQGELELGQEINVEKLQAVIGPYQIQEIQAKFSEDQETLPDQSLTTYKPLLLIVSFLLSMSLLVQFPFDEFSGSLWMRHFMAGFFLVFSFFKFLNLEGFADSYRRYDIIAARWKNWAYVYPFVELSLGVLYLINIAPVLTNLITLIILGVSSIGVIQSVMDKKKIKCACLGDVFNLPMSTVTIVEDVTMVVMAALMLLVL